MAVSEQLPPGESARATSDRPAAVAAARVSRASVLLGALGVASAVFVMVRLVERWSVTAAAASHHVSLFGQQLSYPAANFAAVVVLVLALFGFAVVALAVAGAARELIASLRFGRRVSVCRQFGDALVFEDERLRAFCAGLLKPRVYISTGAVGALDEPALRAVLLHEHHHASRRDPLRLAAGRVAGRALFFVPGIRQLARHQQALAELGADERAIRAGDENRSALARAMLSFSDETDSGESVGIDPGRVDYLLGEPPTWRFPALLCAGALAVLAVIATLALLASEAANGSATLAPPFLSDRPCVVLLGLIPATVGLIALRLARPARRPA
jgi:hypothetical protein